MGKIFESGRTNEIWAAPGISSDRSTCLSKLELKDIVEKSHLGQVTTRTNISGLPVSRVENQLWGAEEENLSAPHVQDNQFFGFCHHGIEKSSQLRICWAANLHFLYDNDNDVWSSWTQEVGLAMD